MAFSVRLSVCSHVTLLRFLHTFRHIADQIDFKISESSHDGASHIWLILKLSLFSGLWFLEKFPRICRPLDGLNSSWDSTDVMNFCSCSAEFLPFFRLWLVELFQNKPLVRLTSNFVVAHFGILQAWLTFVRAPLSSRHFMVYGLSNSFFTFLNEILCNSFKDVDRCICYVSYHDALPFGSSLLYPSSHSSRFRVIRSLKFWLMICCWMTFHAITLQCLLFILLSQYSP